MELFADALLTKSELEAIQLIRIEEHIQRKYRAEVETINRRSDTDSVGSCRS